MRIFVLGLCLMHGPETNLLCFRIEGVFGLGLYLMPVTETSQMSSVSEVRVCLF